MRSSNIPRSRLLEVTSEGIIYANLSMILKLIISFPAQINLIPCIRWKKENSNKGITTDIKPKAPTLLHHNSSPSSLSTTLCSSREIHIQKLTGRWYLKWLINAELMSQANFWNSGFTTMRISIADHKSGANFTARPREWNPRTTLTRIPCSWKKRRNNDSHQFCYAWRPKRATGKLKYQTKN